MIRDELNDRLENLVGIQAANDIMSDGEQMAHSLSIQYGLQPKGSEYEALFYMNILDNVLSHYEVQKQ